MVRNISSTDPGAGKTDGQTLATGGISRGVLEHGRLYEGVVTEVVGSAYDVEVAGSANKILQCRWGLGIFLGLVGYRHSGRFSIGDKVVVLYGNPSYITGSMPRDKPDDGSPRSRTHTGYGVDKMMPGNTQGVAHTFPNDLMSGEFEIANLLGMAMVFCTNLISMKAGDRAKIEVSMINDMVRMVSQEFRHHSAMGDDMIFDDGRLSSESNYTCYRHEAFGTNTEGEALDALINNQYDPDSEDTEVDAENDTGIWRASLYRGWLGDFLHWFISDPQKAVARIGEEQFRPGRSRIWTGGDGTILVQSVSDIILERVVRVQVPKRKKRHDDPEGNTPKDFQTITVEHLKAWKDSDPEKPWERAFQLRQYARWMSQNRSFARFRAASKDWEIPEIHNTQIAPNQPDFDPETEKVDQNADPWIDAFATIRIYRDGSIGVEEAEGASMVMAHGSIWLSAARHLNLEAAGDVRLIAGRNVIVKARRNIDLTAVVGGIVLKARTWWRALCEQGSLWLKSDAWDPDDPNIGSLPEKEANDPDPEVLSHAVVIQASRGRALVKADRTLHLKCAGEPDDDEDVEDISASVLIESAEQGVVVKSHKAFNVFAENIGMTADFFVSKIKMVSWYSSDVFEVNSALVVRSTGVNVSNLKARAVRARYIAGGQCGPLKKKDSIAPMRVSAHYNHVQWLEDDFEVELVDDEERDDFEANVPGSSPVVSVLPLSWKFMSAAEYHWDTGEKTERYVSPTQQTLSLQFEADETGLGDWDWSSGQALQDAPETDKSSSPYGSGVTFYTHNDGDLMNQVVSASNAKNSASGWTLSKMVFIFRQP